ncbi:MULTISPECIES: hypothetical protein [unclassified Janthinobacterium]|uniref:hypothetical protein n=1 Tax=unclassified Janthinobacterium TaxID=2610881 RepID=UPI0003451049|nr:MULTISPECIES: hypothetical protein [unclassified Janthinobacterium]MEC5159378.1 hypothetical protein [Janthinobacterium sp. CG_S6]
MPNQSEYRITPVNSTFLDRARRDGLDDQGQAVERQFAAGGEPCRDVLRGTLPDFVLARFAAYGRYGGRIERFP